MGRPPGWATARTGRPAMRSPGRPPVATREHRQRFWEAVARGLSSEEAGVTADVSPAVGSRWFREAGGMRSISLAPLSARFLSFAEREEIAVLHAAQRSVRDIACQLGRSPSTISRELRRNATTRCGQLQYRAIAAQWHAELDRRGLLACISKRGAPAPIQATTRWVVERTNAWHNSFKKVACCTERRGVVIRFYLALVNAIIIVRRLLRDAWKRYRWDTRPTRCP
jgi:hypothetical protein